MTWRVVLFAVVMIGATTAVSRAQGQAVSDAGADGLFHRVMSPYCVARVLANCPSAAADELRQDIRREIAGGKSVDEVEAGLYKRFGDSIRSEPTADGIGLLAWIFPSAAFVSSAGWLIATIRRVEATGRDATPRDSLHVSPELAARLNDELARLE